ncbi:MAG: hypothetical protein K8F52_18445, partial [Candidatus Scalindua rubra]|nr:hypothetical protein [Candidatus Scalindua rubra]
KGYARFDEGELEIGYGCDTGTLTDERVRNGEHKLQPEATTPALYSTHCLYKSRCNPVPSAFSAT